MWKPGGSDLGRTYALAYVCASLTPAANFTCTKCTSYLGHVAEDLREMLICNFLFY